MRKFILFCFTAVTALFVSLGLMSCDKCSSCNDESWFLPEDSAEIAHIATKVVNPTFDNSTEFVKYADYVRAESIANQILATLDDVTLATIADVVYKRDGIITKQSVADEYQTHPEIYSAIASRVPRAEIITLPNGNTQVVQPSAEDSSVVTNSGGPGDGKCN